MNTHTNSPNETVVMSKSVTAARKPAAKVQGQGHFGIKALIISLSLMGTMGGWGALAVNHIRDTQAKQLEDAQSNMLTLNETYQPNDVNAPRAAGNVATVGVAPKVNLAPKTKVSPVAPRAVPRAPAAPVLIARNDVPAQVLSSAPVLREVQVQPRPVRRSRSSR
ncbi:MAG: hypothetical protein LWW74_02390 [Burkholderiales bacterium]|nr:hypothetical protein [Burkholderiales bacterium]MCE1176670.1 hypothetical protein [Burkholderiales bacterium]